MADSSWQKAGRKPCLPLIFGIEKYLGSGLIKGVGPKFAKKIVQQFGTDTLEIIETDVKRLLEVPGIGKKRVDKIAESWERQKEIQECHAVFAGSWGQHRLCC